MKVKEVMTRDVKTLSPDISAKEAMDMLFDLQISGLPVVDEVGKLLGMFTEKDILKSIFPSYLTSVGSFVYAENPKGIKKKVAELNQLKVGDIMRKEVVAIDEDTTLCEVAHVIITRGVRRIPILDKTRKLVGIVAREDVVKELVRET